MPKVNRAIAYASLSILLLAAPRTSFGVVEHGLVLTEERPSRVTSLRGEVAYFSLGHAEALASSLPPVLVETPDWVNYRAAGTQQGRSVLRLLIEEKFFRAWLYLELAPEERKGDWQLRKGYLVMHSTCSTTNSWYQLERGHLANLVVDERIRAGFLEARFKGISEDLSEANVTLTIKGGLSPICREKPKGHAGLRRNAWATSGR